jgi:hypothetical protein
MKTRKHKNALICTLSRADSAFLQVHIADAGCDQHQWARWQSILREARATAKRRGLAVIEILASKRYGGHTLLEEDL